jgi:aspartate carbamoyltransferase catalytic subunit
LLDLYTIVSAHERAFSTEAGLQLDSLTVALIGDLKNGRTVHSLARLTTRIARPPKLYFVAPHALSMPEYICEELKQAGLPVEAGQDLMGALPQADVLYVTRVQKERFASEAEYNAVKGSYIIDAAAMRSARSDAILLHPLPRVDEIATDVDDDPRAIYFEQMENGMYVRMALLALVLGADLTQL